MVEDATRRFPLLALIVTADIAGLFLGLLSIVQNATESTVARIAGTLPFGWAFAAGMVASVNPCGFFMLPAYLSYQLSSPGGASPASRGSRVIGHGLRALVLDLAATSGFMVVMAAAGTLIGTMGSSSCGTFHTRAWEWAWRWAGLGSGN